MKGKKPSFMSVYRRASITNWHQLLWIHIMPMDGKWASEVVESDAVINNQSKKQYSWTFFGNFFVTLSAFIIWFLNEINLRKMKWEEYNAWIFFIFFFSRNLICFTTNACIYIMIGVQCNEGTNKISVALRTEWKRRQRRGTGKAHINHSTWLTVSIEWCARGLMQPETLNFLKWNDCWFIEFHFGCREKTPFAFFSVVYFAQF